MTVFWLIIIVCLLALLQVICYNTLGLKRVSYERRFEKGRVFAGETTRLIEVIENGKFLPLPWMRVESMVSSFLRFGKQENLEIADARFHRSVFFLGSFKRITRRHEVTPLKRGWYDCSLVSLTAGDLLGLAAPSVDLRTQARLMVYPRIAAPDELPSEALRWQGDASVRRWTDPDPILTTGVREYRAGDSRKDISWAATARMDELYVHQRDYTVEPRLLILFNAQIREDLWGRMEPEEIEVIEQGLSVAASLAAWGTGNGMSAGLRANAGSIMPGAEQSLIDIEPGSCGLEGVLEGLAVLRIERKMSYNRLMENEIERRTSGFDILCISPYWSEELEEKAKQLRRMGNHVQYIPMRGGVSA